MNATKLTEHLFHLCANRPIAVARKQCFLNSWTESDYVAATYSGQLYEYEIKCSRSDFLNDKWKRRNQIYSGLEKGRKPNRFWYVTAGFNLSLDEIPPWAGWYLHYNGKLILQKKAPLLWKGTHDIKVFMQLAFAMSIRGRK